MTSDKQQTNMHDERVHQAMYKGFLRMMNTREADGLKWTGTISDLVELSHSMWMEGYTVGRDGHWMTYTTVIRQLCRTFHVPCPKNHTAVLNNIRRRKTRGTSLFERCRTMMMLYGEEDPIGQMIAPLETASGIVPQRDAF